MSIALPVPVPMYLNVNCGNAFSNPGWMTLGISPESLTSLVPITVNVDELSARAVAEWITKTLRSAATASKSRRSGNLS